MAASSATAFPVKNQAFRTYGRIVSNATGNTITGGLTGLTLTISQDGSGFGSSANGSTVAEIGTTGYFAVDVAAADLNYSAVVLKVVASNSNAVEWAQVVTPLNLAQFTGRWDAQAPLRFEQLLRDVFYLVGGNGVTQNGAALAYLNEDGSTHFSSSVTQSETTGAKTKPA